MSEMRIFPEGDPERHHEGNPHHAAHGRARSRAAAFEENLHVVLDEVRAGQKAHGRLFDFDGRLRRGHEGDVDREDHDHDAENQDQMREEIEPGTIFNHNQTSPINS